MGRHKLGGWQVGELAEPEVGDGDEIGGNGVPRSARLACCIRLFMASSKALLRVWVRRMNTPLKPTPMAPACQGAKETSGHYNRESLNYPHENQWVTNDLSSEAGLCRKNAGLDGFDDDPTRCPEQVAVLLGDSGS